MTLISVIGDKGMIGGMVKSRCRLCFHATMMGKAGEMWSHIETLSLVKYRFCLVSYSLPLTTGRQIATSGCWGSSSTQK